MQQYVHLLLLNFFLTGFLGSAEAQELSYLKGAYFLDGKESELDALGHKLNLDPTLQAEFDRLKKWAYIRQVSGNSFLLSAASSGLSIGSIYLVFSPHVSIPTMLLALTYGPLLGFVMISVSTAAVSLLTWSVATIRTPNLRTEFLYHYNSSLSTSAQETRLEFGLNSGGVGFTLKF